MKIKRVFVYIVLIFFVWHHVRCNDSCPCNCTEAVGKEKVKVVKVQKPIDKVSSSALVKPYQNGRLPRNVKPIHYNVFLDVNMQKKEVNGNATVDVKVLKQTLYIIIHGFDFQTIKGMMFDNQNNVIPMLRQFEYTDNQYYVMELKKEVPAGNYVLQYEYFYQLKTKLSGFYKASYKTKAGVKTGAFTQFQPTDARQAFPCFDEPALRASFDITLGHEKEFIAVSNMPIIKTWYDETKSRRYDKFSRTPLMPTYLLAFAICQFGKTTITADTRKHVKMTFYAPPEQIGMIKYAVKAGSKILSFFEALYNVSYPLPKADMMAVPDFAAGAMENWGLVKYRLTALLYDEVMSPLSDKISVAKFISHELAHMWFGNLVTMEWWSDLWLNEGFASYMEYLGVDAIHPEWKYEDFQVINMAWAMGLDSLTKSHPMHIEVNHPDQINEIFDAISYIKGSSLIRMLNNFMGTKTFFKGINAYLIKYSYKNAKTEDLWVELTKVSRLVGDNHNISQIMNTWVLQMGFPVINVIRTGDGVYKLTQSRFLSERNPDLSNVEFKSPYGYRWIVPFHYITLNTKNATNMVKGPVKSVWLNLTDASINTTSDDYIIKGNAGQYGFFRVNYDKYGWQKIISILKDNHLVFEVKDRVGLLQDCFALVASGRLEYSTAFQLFDYIHKETDYLPWKAARGPIDYVSNLLSQNEGTYKLFQKFMRMKISKLYKKYKFQDVKKFRERKLQILIVDLACHNGHKGCLKQASEMFKKWMNGQAIPNDFRKLVLFYGVHNGGEKEWKFVFEQYLRTSVPSLRSTLLYAMCATQQPSLIDRLLHYSLNASIIKSQDVQYISVYIASFTPHGRYHTWYFLKENWSLIVNRYSSDWSTLKPIISGVVKGFRTEHGWKQVTDFFTEERMKGAGQVKRILTQSLEEVKANIEWLKENAVLTENLLKFVLKADKRY